MKAVRKIERKYYKHNTWVQPVLTTNTSSNIMKVSATDEGQSGAFNSLNGGRWCTTNYVTSATLYIDIYDDVYIDSIKIQGVRNTWGYTKSVTVVADGKNVGSSQNFFSSKSSSIEYLEKTWSFDAPTLVKNISLVVTGETWASLGSVKINGYTIQEATSQEDYDDYIDISTYKLPKINNVYYGINQ